MESSPERVALQVHTFKKILNTKTQPLSNWSSYYWLLIVRFMQFFVQPVDLPLNRPSLLSDCHRMVLMPTWCKGVRAPAAYPLRAVRAFISWLFTPRWRHIQWRRRGCPHHTHTHTHTHTTLLLHSANLKVYGEAKLGFWHKIRPQGAVPLPPAQRNE